MPYLQKSVFFKLFCPVILLLLLVATGNVWAALPGYMKAHAETQGDIEGSVTESGREGTMKVVEFGHNVSALMDATGTFVPSGKRQHRPIRVVKDIDKASPMLMNVLTNSELLESVRIDFWAPATNGNEYQFYTVELVNAYIVSIIQNIGSEGELLNIPARETITFSYQKIVWTWQDGGITAEDDWETPRP